MMATIAWVLVVAFFSMVLFALHQFNEVRVGVKMPLATFFFEAKRRNRAALAKREKTL